MTSTKQALTASNGLWTNGLTTNGLWTNGLWTNGLWTNGLWTNGLWTNGLWTNGLWTNGLWTNGLWTNGLWTNGLWTNGLWTNGLWTNGLWTNGLTGDAAVPGDTLRNSPYLRQLLQYIYSCSMPAATYDGTGATVTSYATSLDPNTKTDGTGSLPCSSPGDTCDLGYECSLEGKCVIPLQGAVGVAINDDGTTWWGQPAPGGATDLGVGKWGQCDESCQRWVSACVLARTNAYGVHVEISMRAPTVVPANASPGRRLQFAAIQAALAPDPTSNELTDFTAREGAFYGNIFATTPVDPPQSATYSGPATGPVASTPVFYACAGPDSNIPSITKRFCSSQGDQSVIAVPGVCVTTKTEKGACDGLDGGSIHGCYTSVTAPRAHYDEVITVYLQQGIAVCGNSVCESPEEDATSCASDCHPGGWAESFEVNFNISSSPFLFGFQGTSAVSPVDDTIVLVGRHDSDHSALVGGDPLPAGESAIVAKYAPDGTYLWGRRFPMGSTSLNALVADDGSIFAAGHNTQGNQLLEVAKLTPDGDFAPGWPIKIGGSGADSDPPTSRLGVATDAKGNLYMACGYTGTATFATTPPTTFTSSVPAGQGPDNIFVTKVRPNGTVAWAVPVGAGFLGFVTSFSLDRSSGDLLLSAQVGGSPFTMTGTSLFRITSATGAVSTVIAAPLWDSTSAAEFPSPRVYFRSVGADANGELYVTGDFHGTYDFGCGAMTATAREFFLVRYSPDGTQCRWVARASTTCPPDANYCTGLFGAGALGFDPDGNVVVGGQLDALNTAGILAPAVTPTRGAVVDFGGGPFDNFHYADVFVASYSPDGYFLWSKQVPIVLQGNLGALGVDSQRRVVLSGTYTGSIEIDDRLLVNTIPEGSAASFANTYLASFTAPSTADTTMPAIGAARDPNGAPLFTVPNHIYTQATSAAGAVVFYMPPTALDDGDAGVQVACSPRPNTMFPIGTTIVGCTATDPVGNTSTARFQVTVIDGEGPLLTPVADLPPVQGTSAAGASVPYQAPTATDQVDGPTPVNCVPASGATFGVGTTTVTCTAIDQARNPSQATFKVTVTPPPFGGPCTSTAQCGAGLCVDGVCCNTTGMTCGQCQACNVQGSLGTCAPTSGGSCSDNNACTTGDVCSAGACVGGPPPAPVLNPGSNQTVVGSCSSAPVAYAAPTLAGVSCDSATKVTCTTIPGNSYGAHAVTCKARDARGVSSAPVSFTVTVLQPLTVRVQPPLYGDNDAIDNVVKAGSTVPVKVQLYACGVNVTRTASVTAKLAVKAVPSGGSSVTKTVTSCSDAPNTNGVMVLDGANYRYNLSTKGYAVTYGVPTFLQVSVTVAYKAAPSIVAGSDAIQLDTK